MSAYRVLYDDVYEALEASTLVKTVADYNEQYDNAENFNIDLYPACYVEAADVEWDKSQNNFRDGFQTEPQTGIGTIKVHVVYKTLKAFDKETKDAFYYLGNHVVSILQRLKTGQTDGGTYTTLMRVGEEYLTPVKQLRVVVYEFETQLTDIFEPIETVEEKVTAILTTIYDMPGEEKVLTDDGEAIITDDIQYVYTQKE